LIEALMYFLIFQCCQHDLAGCSKSSRQMHTHFECESKWSSTIPAGKIDDVITIKNAQSDRMIIQVIILGHGILKFLHQVRLIQECMRPMHDLGAYLVRTVGSFLQQAEFLHGQKQPVRRTFRQAEFFRKKCSGRRRRTGRDNIQDRRATTKRRRFISTFHAHFT